VSGTLRSISFESARFAKLRRFSSIVSRVGAKSPAPLRSQRIAAHRAQLTQLPMRSVPRNAFVLTNPINSRFVGNSYLGIPSGLPVIRSEWQIRGKFLIRAIARAGPSHN